MGYVKRYPYLKEHISKYDVRCGCTYCTGIRRNQITTSVQSFGSSLVSKLIDLNKKIDVKRDNEMKKSYCLDCEDTHEGVKEKDMPYKIVIRNSIEDIIMRLEDIEEALSKEADIHMKLTDLHYRIKALEYPEDSK